MVHTSAHRRGSAPSLGPPSPSSRQCTAGLTSSAGCAVPHNSPWALHEGDRTLLARCAGVGGPAQLHLQSSSSERRLWRSRCKKFREVLLPRDTGGLRQSSEQGLCYALSVVDKPLPSHSPALVGEGRGSPVPQAQESLTTSVKGGAFQQPKITDKNHRVVTASPLLSAITGVFSNQAGCTTLLFVVPALMTD